MTAADVLARAAAEFDEAMRRAEQGLVTALLVDNVEDEDITWLLAQSRERCAEARADGLQRLRDELTAQLAQ